MFIYYSSAFNTIVPSKQVLQLRDLGRGNSICKTVTPDSDNNDNNDVIKLVDDPTVIGLISDSDERALLKETV